MDVVAADVHLPSCGDRARASGCVAGERTRFVVEARDSRGNRLCAGGAASAPRADARVGAHARGVLDQGDGTYAASYAVDKAGPYVLVLSAGAGGSRLALEGTCSPGTTDVTRCVVDASGLAQLTAGTRGVVKIVRRDKFGNAVEAGPDVLPFRVEATGVGPVSVETVESGDGGCEIRFEAKAAGRYALHAWSGYKRDAVAGSPFDVVVLPGQASASSCVAQLVGTTHAVGGPGVVAAVAGETLSVRMQARDRFGNATAWKRWQTLSVAAPAPRTSCSRNGWRIRRGHRRGCPTIVRRFGRVAASSPPCFQGGRVRGVVHRRRPGGRGMAAGHPGGAQHAAADASEWRAEAETMALTSEIASNAPFDRTGGLATRDTRRAPSARRPGPRRGGLAPRASRQVRGGGRGGHGGCGGDGNHAQAARQGGGDGQGGSDPEVGDVVAATTSATARRGEARARRSTRAPRVSSGFASSPRRRKTIGRRGRRGSGAGEDPAAR